MLVLLKRYRRTLRELRGDDHRIFVNKELIDRFLTVSHPDEEKPFVVEADASDYGIEGVLSQCILMAMKKNIGRMCAKHARTKSLELQSAPNPQWTIEEEYFIFADLVVVFNMLWKHFNLFIANELQSINVLVPSKLSLATMTDSFNGKHILSPP
ncbi:hypothetical protein MIR68_000046 [Amoeboaphelidium protococcarum]|nr:hypothetical protein MIR68_000046 [Amoeboaphelidium protococcarum]